MAGGFLSGSRILFASGPMNSAMRARTAGYESRSSSVRKQMEKASKRARSTPAPEKARPAVEAAILSARQSVRRENEGA